MNTQMAAVSLRKLTGLTSDQAAAVLALVAAAAGADGVAPLSERVTMALREASPQSAPRSAGGSAARRSGRHGTPSAEPGAYHLLAEHAGELVGYAHLERVLPSPPVTSSPASGSASPDPLQPSPLAELAVHPDVRQHGVGRALLSALVAAEAQVRLWAHGQLTAANYLATRAGFEPERVLWQFRRQLASPLPKPTLPAGLRLRPFDRARDWDSWLALNATAFAELPDQAGWSGAELDARLKEQWFDAAGFQVAEHVLTGELAGFVWTKIAAADPDVPSRPEPSGELYVVGVAPSWRGRGLGRALTLVALNHLRDQGMTWSTLYVEATNQAAVGLYNSLGFTHFDTDTLYRRPA
ncbi:MAG: mycothiol synthase [Candidatus Nanopelagicales bacterium]